MPLSSIRSIALKQSFAFMIDLALISLPLLAMMSLDGLYVFQIIWVLYIPLATFRYI
jgi:hypothetical protein